MIVNPFHNSRMQYFNRNFNYKNQCSAHRARYQPPVHYPGRPITYQCGYVPASQKIMMGLGSMEKLESATGKTITSQALIDSYMAISKNTAISQRELAPIKKENSFGMTVIHKMNRLTVPRQTLLQDVTTANTDMIESVPIALSFQSMMETRRAAHEYKVSHHTIPTWKCIVFGKEQETRIYEVLKVLRHWMRLQWILDLKVKFEELEEGKTFVCAWMLSVRKLPSFGHRHSMALDPLVFEDIRASDSGNVLAEHTNSESHAGEQGVPVPHNNQIKVEHELNDQPEETETSVNDSYQIKIEHETNDQPKEPETSGTEVETEINQAKIEREPE